MKIRFPLMAEWYLRSRVVGIAAASDAAWMEDVVAEALRAKAARWDGAGFDFKLLGPKALDDRMGQGVRWIEYADGGGRRLKGHTSGAVKAVAEYEGRVCSGSYDGSIRVWTMTGDVAAEQIISPINAGDSVFSLSAWDGRLISGHSSGRLRAWNVVTGACDQVLEGHGKVVYALAVCGSRLASGGFDRSIKVWAAGALCTCERTLLGHTHSVGSLAGWQDKVLSGSLDKSIRVWDVGTGAHEATLLGHTRGVCGLAVHGDRLFSASRDCTIRAWALGTWVGLRTVEAYRVTGHPYCLGQYPHFLAVSGSQLISGSCGADAQHEVQVWGLETLDLQHTLPLPTGQNVGALLAVEGKVWAGVGRDVMVWGCGAWETGDVVRKAKRRVEWRGR
jgi:WD40 repeat protein